MSAPAGVSIIRPSNRVAWHDARGKDVTASQIGALFPEYGGHEYVTLYGLWAAKSGRVAKVFEETDAIRRGRHLEIVAVNLLREDYPDWKIEHNAAENVYYRDPLARLGATPDVIVQAPLKGRGVVQVKSVEASIYRRKWLDENGNPEPPLWIALQAMLEAHLTGATWAAVAPLVVGHGLDMPLIEIPLDDMPNVVAAMKARSADFWEMIAEGREPPADYSRDGAVIEAVHGLGDPEHEIDLSQNNHIPELLEQRRGWLAEKRVANEQIDKIDAEVKALMGSAHVAHLGRGRRITWKPEQREGHFVQPSTIRALRYPNHKD